MTIRFVVGVIEAPFGRLFVFSKAACDFGALLMEAELFDTVPDADEDEDWPLWFELQAAKEKTISMVMRKTMILRIIYAPFFSLTTGGQGRFQGSG